MDQQLSIPFPSFGPSPALGAFAVPLPGDQARIEALLGKADWAQGVIRMSKALLEAGRQIDIAGLDQTIGQICAGAIDLGPELGGSLRPRLLVLLEEMDALTAALQPECHPA